MKKIILSGILIFTFQVLFSQEDITQTDSIKIMEKSDFLGLRTSVYKVADLAEAKEWYSKAFLRDPYFDEPFYVGFNIGGYELGLLPEEKPVSEKTKSLIVYWGVNDIEKVYNHLLKMGASEHEKPTNVGGDLMVASVIDPWENVIGIIYNPAFKIE